MTDPTYNIDEIKKNPVWHVAWVLSEIQNDDAPIGWSKKIPTAEHLLAAFKMKAREK